MAKRLQDLVKETRGRGFHGPYWEIYRDWVEGRLEIEDPNPPRSFYEYMIRPDYSSWFWCSVLILIATGLSIYLSQYLELAIYARYILGSIAVLFLPGYLLIEALYPSRRDLSPLERLALSIGLSLAVIPLIGLILNYTPWGIRLDPIFISISIYDLAVSIIAQARKYSLLKLRLLESR